MEGGHPQQVLHGGGVRQVGTGYCIVVGVGEHRLEVELHLAEVEAVACQQLLGEALPLIAEDGVKDVFYLDFRKIVLEGNLLGALQYGAEFFGIAAHSFY